MKTTRWLVLSLVVALLCTCSEAKKNKQKNPKQGIRNDRCSKLFKNAFKNAITMEGFEPRNLTRTLVGNCEVNVGKCPTGSCRRDPRVHPKCPDDGYICPITLTEIVECDVSGQSTEFKVEVIEKCVCCKDNGFQIEARVQNAVDGHPLFDISVHTDGIFAGKSSADGIVKIHVNPNTLKLVILAHDDTNEYIDAVKVIDLIPGFRGPEKVEVKMIKKAIPVEIDSNMETTLAISNTPSDHASGNAQIVIGKGSFRATGGGLYNGQVKVSITVIDTTNPGNDPIIPGQFLTQTRSGIENLVSDGVINFDFRDNASNPLHIDSVTFKVRKGMAIWNLDTKSGTWVQAKSTTPPHPNRGKRQIDLTTDLITKLETGQWVNIDKIPGAPMCFIKLRVVYANPKEADPDAKIKPNAVTFILPERFRFNLYFKPTTVIDAETACFRVPCPDNPKLIGFIGVQTYETIMMDGVSVPYMADLVPLPFDEYDDEIHPALESVRYEVTEDKLSIFANFIASKSGPFYSDEESCVNSNISQPSFHFKKPVFPSYLDVPDDTEYCEARVIFENKIFFPRYAVSPDRMAQIFGISVWDKFYYTSKTQSDFLYKGKSYFGCLRYRCSDDRFQTKLHITIMFPINHVRLETYVCNIGPRPVQLVNGSITISPPIDIESAPGYFRDGKCDESALSNQYALRCYQRLFWA